MKQSKLMKIGLSALLCFAASSFAGEPPEMTNSRSAELERVAMLAGTWKGVTNMGQGEQEIVVAYRVTGGGSTVIETCNPGTPHEMISIYHDDVNDRLTMTHYCMLGNQPRMNLRDSGDASLSLSLSDGSSLATSGEPHMRALRLEFAAEDAITHHWTMYEEGRKKMVHSFALTRAE